MRNVTVAVLLLSSVLLGRLFGQSKPDPPTDEQLQQWVGNLESDSYSSRSVATERLILAGERAIAPVTGALERGGLETIIRGIYVLRQLALMADEPATQDAAYQALEVLAERRITTASRRAASAMVAINDVRRNRAQQYLEQLGAVIARAQIQVDEQSIQPFPSVSIGKTWRGTVKDLEQIRWLTNDRTNREAVKWVISLFGQQTVDEWTNPITQLDNIAAVHLNSTSITDNGVEKLTVLKDLQFVEILYSPVTDRSIAHLSSVSNLSRVKLFGTQITAEGAQRLRETVLGIAVDHRQGGFLGIACEDNPCRISLVRPQSAAARAGLMYGDVISNYNGNAVNTMDELTALISKDAAGETVKLSVRRGTQRLESEIVLGRWELP